MHPLRTLGRLVPAGGRLCRRLLPHHCQKEQLLLFSTSKATAIVIISLELLQCIEKSLA